MSNNIRQSDPKDKHALPNKLLLALFVAVSMLFAIDYMEKKNPIIKGAQSVKVDPLNPVSEDTFNPLNKEIHEQPRNVNLQTEKYNFTLDLNGGKITKLELRDFVKEKTKDELVSVFYEGEEKAEDGETTNAVTFDAGWLANGVDAPTRTTQWTIAGKTEDSIMLTYDNGHGIRFYRNFKFDKNKFLVNVEDKAINDSGKDVQLIHYSQIHHRGEREERLANSFTNYTGPEAIVDHDYIKADYGDLKDGDKFFNQGNNVWAGLTTQYFAGVIIPDNAQENSVSFKHSKIAGDDYYTALVKGPVEALKSGSEVSNTYNIYAGPKSTNVLADQGLDESIKLSAMLNYGWFHPIASVIFDVMNFINDYINNLALSIIAVTILLKVLLFPLANKSYHSMAEMKKIQPKLKKLQEKYGKDRQMLGLETMKLYKEHKVSPASGCWPMLIQIPIFFSMYKVILMSFEFRQADLGLWIHDMSSKDPYFVLPILMGITMIIQQKLNPQPVDETQKMVMNTMPVVFTVMFLFFPSGLVLYWLTNNVLSIVQQYIIMKKHQS
ncbi:MAG: membrane protein insertase YidC [Proteobacteria bacterium]|nr:membrane protein insertase YidC [Pseudomonadota bacterium]